MLQDVKAHALFREVEEVHQMMVVHWNQKREVGEVQHLEVLLGRVVQGGPVHGDQEEEVEEVLQGVREKAEVVLHAVGEVAEVDL